MTHITRESQLARKPKKDENKKKKPKKKQKTKKKKKTTMGAKPKAKTEKSKEDKPEETCPEEKEKDEDKPKPEKADKVVKRPACKINMKKPAAATASDGGKTKGHGGKGRGRGKKKTKQSEAKPEENDGNSEEADDEAEGEKDAEPAELPEGPKKKAKAKAKNKPAASSAPNPSKKEVTMPDVDFKGNRPKFQDCKAMNVMDLTNVVEHLMDVYKDEKFEEITPPLTLKTNPNFKSLDGWYKRDPQQVGLRHSTGRSYGTLDKHPKINWWVLKYLIKMVVLILA